MSYIQFDKTQLINLRYSLDKEVIRANKWGCYGSSTLIGCNTRKYHGLLVAPQPQIDGEFHVLLSTLDETVIQHEKEFHLGIHKYPGNYHPRGHKYLKDFIAEPIPKLIYRVGGLQLSRENLLVHNEDRILIRYTLLDAHSPTILRLQPFLAFRQRHKLSKANHFVNKQYEPVDRGVKLRMYAGYSELHMQTSCKSEFVAIPDWHYNIEYIKEKERGYPYREDLYVPGYFEFSIEKGESVVFSAGITEANPHTLKKQFSRELKRRVPRDNFENCLKNAASQFIIERGDRSEVIAGYPWFGRWGRDTFIALPGLTLAQDDPKTCRAVIKTMLKDLKGPLFPNLGHGQTAALNSVDAPLWFFWTLQELAKHTGNHKKIWKHYGDKMRLILEGYRQGTEFNIKMQDNGLIFAGQKGVALTWMDAVVDGVPVTPRTGMPVEINALWYNAVCFSLEVAALAKDHRFVEAWKDLPEIIRQSFVDTFWDKEQGYLADYVNGDYKDWAVRPNQLFATSLPYSPLNEEQRELVLEMVRRELLTWRGVRTLSPKHKDYKGVYYGDQRTRDRAYHNGTVWPWLLGHFVEGYLKIHGKSTLSFIKRILQNFSEVMTEHGISTVSEIYEGNPPYAAKGAVSQAWSVAELLRIHRLIEQYT